MNVRDSEFVMGLLLADGFRAARTMDGADVIIFNSCSVRQHAEDRLLSNIASLTKLKRKRPGLVIALMGCTAQSLKEKILERVPIVDISCGPGNEEDLPRLIREVLADRCPVVAVDKLNMKPAEAFPAYRDNAFRSFVSIGYGCNNFCSYCIVPYVRGRERSRDAVAIVKEVKQLARQGCKEVTLLGQNVNSYKEGRGAGRKGHGFVQLLEQLDKIKGIERIRFMTSHPKDATPELFRAMCSLDKVCEHLHLPLQSGSDRILKLMNRGYTARHYRALIDAYRRIVPGGSVTTDIIVGFPSETKADFAKTEKLMEEVGFAGAFVFKYSPRPPAVAARLADNVSAEEKERRLQILLELQNRQSQLSNKELEGSVVEVLVDGINERTPAMLSGRMRTNKTVLFPGEKRLVGTLVEVRVERTPSNTLTGRIVHAT